MEYRSFQIPPNCRSGQTYKRTKGYQKLAGDQCRGGETENHLGAVDEPCPWIEESAFILVTSSSGMLREYFLLSVPCFLVTKFPCSYSSDFHMLYLKYLVHF